MSEPDKRDENVTVGTNWMSELKRKADMADEVADTLECMIKYYDPGIPREPKHPINMARAILKRYRGG